MVWYPVPGVRTFHNLMEANSWCGFDLMYFDLIIFMLGASK